MADYSSDEDEGPARTKYWVGGAGDTLCEGRYRVTKQLGDGRLSTVYEAVDKNTNRPCAVKVYRFGADNFRYFANEYRACKELSKPSSDAAYIIVWLGASAHLSLSGPRPNVHPVLVYQVYGESLYSFLKRLDSGLALSMAKRFAVQILKGLRYIHGLGLVHADIKTGNILLNCPLESAKDESELGVVIADIGMTTPEDNLFELSVGTQEYLSPECIFGVGYDHTTDIWSFGCVLYEMITGDFLFDVDQYDPSDFVVPPKRKKCTEGFSSDEDSDQSEDYDLNRNQLIMIESYIGSIPKSLVQYGRRYYNASGHLKGKPKIIKNGIGKMLTSKYEGISITDAAAIEELLLMCLRFDSKERASANTLLSHRLLQN